MQFSVAVLMLLLAGGFILAGLLFKARKRSGYVFISGFVVLMVLGLLLSYDELTVKNGEVLNAVNNTTTIVTYSYEEPNAITNSVLSMVLILGGLWGIIATSTMMKADSEEDEEE